MRKRLIALLLGVTLLLPLCAGCTQKPTPLLPGEYPMDFLFTSGAGNWATRLTLNADGSFSGLYHDSDMGDDGPGYPNGTVYLCTFSGRFEVQPTDDSSVTPLLLTEVICEVEPGTQEIKDGFLHVYTGPHGFYNQDRLSPNFLLYPPTTPTATLNQDLLSWWPGRYEINPPDTLNCYALWNADAGAGFFTDLPITN